MAINNEKLKTVENYVLETQRYINSDQSQIWVARHKILKKNYMLKRIHYAKNQNQKIANFETNDEVNAFKLKKVSYQIEVLKHLKLSGSPKCQKMIKTSNCIYIVYDEFPGASLHQLATNGQLSQEQKLKTMINLSKTLLKYHNFSIYFLLLSPDNVFLSENQNVFFGEWSSVVYKNNTSHTFPILTSRQSQFIANQVIQESRCSPASDVFSLGKIFKYLADKNKKYFNNQSDLLDLKALSQHMTWNDDKKRPSMPEVIERLENILKSLPLKNSLTKSKGLCKSKLQHVKSQISFCKQESEISQEKYIQMKNTASSSNLREKLPLESKQIRASRLSSKYSFDSILIGMSRATNRPSLSRSTRSNQLLVKKVTKYRNLSFFLIGLSEFAMKWPQGDVLGYLLMKQGYLTLNVCYNQWNSQGFQDKSSKALTDILKAEILQLNLSLNMLKEYLLPQKCDQQFKAELRNDLLINDRFYKEQSLAFCKRLMEDFNTAIKENKIKNLSEFVDNLFSVYMILKREEQVSFQKFWDKIYRSEYAFLKNQSYFQEQKKLGYRYLRSKISQILGKK